MTIGTTADSSETLMSELLVINEVLASHAGTDTSEFVELWGTPGLLLEGYSLIVVEGDEGGAGSIDLRIDFGADDRVGDNGFFLIGNSAGLESVYGVSPDFALADNSLENSSLTVMIVETASLSSTALTGTETVIDSVGLSDGGANDQFFGEGPVIGPDGSFFPAGVRRVTDGVDTDAAADWALADFNLGTDNTPTAASFNAALVINEFLADPASDLSGDANGDGTRDATQDEFVEIVNAGSESFDLSGVTLSDAVGVRHVFAAGTTLAAGAAIVVFGGGTPSGAFGGAQVTTASSGALGLNNGGDTITLTSADGTTVLAELSYGSEGSDNQSLTRSPELTGDFIAHSEASGALFSPGTESDGTPFGAFVESFEEAPGAGYTLTGAFDDGSFDYFGRFPAPDSSNGARDDFTEGFDGAYAIQAQDVDGDGGDATGVVTIADISIAGQAEPVLIASFGALDSEPSFSNYEAGDGIQIFASVDGGERVLIGAFAPPEDGGDLRLDTDLDGIGDGAVLTTELRDFAFALPTGESVTLEFELTSTDSFEPLVLDNVRVGDGLSLEAPEAPPEEVLISEVQGNGTASPLEGQRVLVEAVVVSDFQNTDGATRLGGFFMQEEDADADGDALTSEGIFVYDGNAPQVDVSAGDLVRVTGTVEEYNGKTELTDVSVEIVSSGNTLPTAAEITFPVASLIENEGVLTADLEMYEGMLVTLPQEMTVGDVYSLGRYGEIDLNAQGMLPTYTQVNAPDAEGYHAYLEEAARNAIVLDDGSTAQNPETIPFEIAGESGDVAGSFDAGDALGSGDTVSGLTGVLDFGFDQYRIQATEAPEFVDSAPREEDAPEVSGTLKVSTFNVLNYFTSLGDEGLTSGPDGMEPRGADNLLEFERQTDKLIAAMAEIGADVFSLLEVENEFGDQNGDGEFAIESLVNALNAATGSSYVWLDPGTPYVGSDAISVGMIYNSQTVTLAEDTNVATLTEGDLAGLGLDFGNPVFEGDGTSRVPLAATFEQASTGEAFTVAVNHFKSKGSVSPFGDNEDAGDGAGNNNEARLQAAMALDAWLDSNPTGSDDPDILITGDLNSYAMEDPVQFLISEGYVDSVGAFGGGYSYGFPLGDAAPQVQGFGTLDYALASSSLFEQVTGADVWNINAGEASVLDYNTNYKSDAQIDELYDADPYRSSDHDPVLVGMDLQSREIVLGDAGSGPLRGSDADEILDGQGGRLDVMESFAGDDIFVFTDIEGARDALNILDYTPGEDRLDLSGELISQVRATGNNLRLTLDPEDGDYILLHGVTSLDQLHFVDTVFLA
ncbi:hypothetical protein AYJ57_20175 [Salipiger sp. CCB-MM3]|nr:hypothetical protein AYJ57_20175 [Salipiger sp. CCB-MM3]